KSVAVGDCQLEIAVACFFAAASKFASSRDAIRSARSLALSSRRCAAVTAFLGSLPIGAELSLLAGTTSEGLRSGTTPEGVTAMTFGCGVRCQRVDHQASDTRAQIKRAVAATNERLNARRGLSARACARFQVAANLGMACSSASRNSLNSVWIFFSSPTNSISNFRCIQSFAQPFLAALVMLARAADRDAHHLSRLAQTQVFVKDQMQGLTLARRQALRARQE